jgi:ABC-type lipoprotein release transport system permease subunit
MRIGNHSRQDFTLLERLDLIAVSYHHLRIVHRDRRTVLHLPIDHDLATVSTERTREIGIRKAIGAKQSDILLQFLIEAATLTGFGGVIGLLIGWILTFLVKMIMPSYVPLWAPIAGFGASVLIGVFFGLWPAWKAARLDPIESLRYE